MRKINLCFVLFFVLFGLSSAFSQDLQSNSHFNTHTTLNNPPQTSVNGINVNKMLKTGEKALGWQPDTILHYGTTSLEGRITFTYNDNGNVLTKLEESGSLLVNGFRHTYTYDSNENLLTQLTERDRKSVV